MSVAHLQAGYLWVDAITSDGQNDIVTVSLGRHSRRFTRREPPFRLCYIGSAYRAIRPQRGQMREFSQAGVELIGADALTDAA